VLKLTFSNVEALVCTLKIKTSVENQGKTNRVIRIVPLKYSRMMDNHKLTIFFVSAILLFLVAGSVLALDAHLMEVRIRGIDRAGPPKYLDRQVLLSYQSSKPVRLVGARFAHEEYRVFHIYFRNENDVFLLLLDVPEEIEELRYRMVVDGLWISDPFNPRSDADAFGRAFSLFSLHDRPARMVVSPEIHRDGSVTFFFRSPPDRAVSVAGDFNNWDPFWHRLRETRPGEYSITVRMPPGQHFYYYTVNGQRLLDPINQDTARDYEGFRVSTFILPPPETR